MISENIKRLRKEKGYTQKDLAKTTGLSISTIQGYEQKQYKPKLENVRLIAAALGVTMSDLIDDWSSYTTEEFFIDLLPATDTTQDPADNRNRLLEELQKYVSILIDEHLEMLVDIAKTLYERQEKRRKGRTYPLPKRSDQNPDIPDPEQ